METHIESKRTTGSTISLIAFTLISMTVLFVFTVPFTWELFWIAVASVFLYECLQLQVYTIDTFRITHINL